MPFDVRDFAGAPPEERAASRRNRRLVAAWLLTVAGMILVMIALGGATRLTGSGLSIMEWAPLSGTLPPMSEAEWHRLFALYQQIPQYQLINRGFGLDGFKHIFWLEWTHRLWGRLIGVVFLLPLAVFWATGRIERRLRPRLALLFLLGGLQGAVGWFMVASGFFADSTAVSAYRLVVHLVLALVLYAAILWTGLGLLAPARDAPIPPRGLRLAVRLTVALVALTIVAGGFVAGIHAGLSYNTFPLMDGKLIPDGYADVHPLLRNLTENIATVQFDHRLLATLTAVAILLTLAAGLGAPNAARLRPRLLALGLTMAVQYALGVATLLAVVPADLATAHQICATLLLTAALVLLHGLRQPRAR
ncbi:MAG: COX15/CtaA family protein [Acetobacteraceae bacterium]|nr:COX15/CtaA family protein [Acetobacteraceae bacterium]